MAQRIISYDESRAAANSRHADRLCIKLLTKRTYGNYFGFMAKKHQFAPPKGGCRTGLDPNQARGKLRKEANHLRSPEPLPKNHCPACVNSDYLKRDSSQLQPDRGDR